MTKAICHITHLNNLPAILQAGGLWCDRETENHVLTAQGIAHSNIKNRRRKRKVTVGTGGFLCDYVPFYFCPRSPMLYTISQGNVVGYNGGQADILHLVSQTEIVEQHDLPFVFTDGHAEMLLSKQFDNLDDLNKLDWTIISARHWHDTNEDNDRKRRKQAEFLVHHFFPWTGIMQIGIMTEEAANNVSVILAQQENPPPIVVRRNWYY